MANSQSPSVNASTVKVKDQSINKPAGKTTLGQSKVVNKRVVNRLIDFFETKA